MLDEKIFIDPVCKMKVKKPNEVEMQMLSISYENKIYYFCSHFCTAEFIQNPSRYVNAALIEE
ncbi:MAG: YHS domain-containing protein [Bacteroidetes bacterium]|nr:YHS domain-containing protein [Bacteroidota bacterium]MBU1680622.1 YHS domain-containing protein [Bacteroidota bacterium]MBU2508001.1 YHS domain-containing protein [Bacteroidota bacterium]